MKNKLKDNEIIKALEYCAEDKCLQCPLQDGVCSEKYVMKEARDLITRQQAEIERLKKVVLDDYATEYDNKIKSEAVKEFAWRLKEWKWLEPYRTIKEKDIDNLVKKWWVNTMVTVHDYEAYKQYLLSLNLSSAEHEKILRKWCIRNG